MANKIYIQYLKTNVGEMILGAFNQQLCLLDYRYRNKRTAIDKRLQNGLKAHYEEKSVAVLTRTKQQVNEYLLGQRQQFDIPLLMVGTVFQKQVWTALQAIPHAATLSYLQLAKKINKDKAVRAVAMANGANAMSMVIPCHRVIGHKGALTGYAGGLAAKQYLLDLERAYTL